MYESLDTFEQHEEHTVENLIGAAKRLRELVQELDEVFMPRQYLRDGQHPPDFYPALIEFGHRAEDCIKELRRHAAEDVRFEQLQDELQSRLQRMSALIPELGRKRSQLSEDDIAAWEKEKQQFLAAADHILSGISPDSPDAKSAPIGLN